MRLHFWISTGTFTQFPNLFQECSCIPGLYSRWTLRSESSIRFGGQIESETRYRIVGITAYQYTTGIATSDGTGDASCQSRGVNRRSPKNLEECSEKLFHFASPKSWLVIPRQWLNSLVILFVVPNKYVSTFSEIRPNNFLPNEATHSRSNRQISFPNTNPISNTLYLTSSSIYSTPKPHPPIQLLWLLCMLPWLQHNSQGGFADNQLAFSTDNRAAEGIKSIQVMFTSKCN
jgi:hypothetical protein